MADRYTGRHIRQARHGAWVNKKRSRARSSRHALPAAAALTVAGVLIGGAGTAIQLSAAGSNGDADLTADYDPANFPPPDRAALAGRTSRDEARTGSQDNTTASRQAGNAAVVTGSCVASYYDDTQATASGETADPGAHTAAHKNLPFNSLVRVVNVTNGKSVIVRINDRGPYVNGRCLDLSRAAFQEISSLGAGLVDVRFEVLVQDAT